MTNESLTTITPNAIREPGRKGTLRSLRCGFMAVVDTLESLNFCGLSLFRPAIRLEVLS